jgi:hypothetical protein
LNLPDGKKNIYAIEPLNNFLDEIIVYAGGYLHIAKVFEKRLIMDSVGNSEIEIVEALPWSVINQYFGDHINFSVKSGDTRYIALDNNGLISFSNAYAGTVMKTVNQQMKTLNVNAK